MQTEQVLKSQRESALAELVELKATVSELTRARSDDQTRLVELSKRLSEAELQHSEDIRERDGALAEERDRAFAEVAKLTSTVEGLSRARPDAGPGEQTKRWLGPIAVGIVLLAAIAGAFVSSPGRKSDSEVEAKFAGLTATVTKSDKARQDAEAKATQTAAALAKSEQARQAAEAKAADAEKARQAAAARADDADKARQTAEAKAADADKARQAALAKANDADKARLAAEAKAAGTVTSGPASPSSQFTRRSNMEAKGDTAPLAWALIASIDVCEKYCTLTAGCNAFTYNKKSTLCFTYKNVDLVPNENYDSGVLATVTSGLASPSGRFSPRSSMEVRGVKGDVLPSIASVGYCQQSCAQSDTCKAFTYSKPSRLCYLYTSFTDLVVNENYNSGIRQ